MKPRSPLALVFALGLAACPAWAAESFDGFVERVSADWVRHDPQTATNKQYFSGAEQDALDRQLTAEDDVINLPIEPGQRQAALELAQRILAELRTYDRATLTPVQRTAAGVLESRLQQLVEAIPFADHWFVFNQFRGLQVTLVSFLTETHPIRHRRDIENYLVRLAQVGPLLDLGLAEARARAEKNLIPPRFILTATLRQIDGFMVGEPAANVLVASLAERAAKVKDLSAADRATFVAEAERMVRTAVLPAYGRIRDL
ncbi:MAG: DUF885 family protein, partial [Verrucomicrobiota bacterium]